MTTIAVPRDAYDRFAKFCEERRLVLRRVTADLLDWFMGQAPAVQTAVSGAPKRDGMELAYAEVLESVARDLRQAHDERMGSAEGAQRRVVTDDSMHPEAPRILRKSQNITQRRRADR